MFPDHVVACPPGARRRVERALFELEPGVTELALHPGIDTDELRAACSDDWSGRVEDHALLSRDPSFRDLVARSGADRRRLARAPRPAARPDPRLEQLDWSGAGQLRASTAASTSSTSPRSPAVFMRPCMNAALGGGGAARPPRSRPRPAT